MELESFRVSSAPVQDNLVSLLTDEKLAHSELIWSLFCSALASFKRETLLRPFPPQFITEESHKDFISLVSYIFYCPSLAA